MSFAREIKHVMLGTIFLLLLIGASATYWALAGQNSILRRDDNPRLIEALARVRRGGIYDRDGELLVQSQHQADGVPRTYYRPSTFSVVGYYSLRYGSAGAEAAYDDDLNGSDEIHDLEDLFAQRILQIPPTGADIRLTLSVTIQEALVNAMQGFQGAAIVMEAQSGALLALASLPSYDPNSLDTDWEGLIAADGKPFFNRALQGLYQPGSAMSALWLARAIQGDFDLARIYAESDAPVVLDSDTTVACVTKPAASDLSLTEAFAFGCPAPFVSFQSTQSADSHEELLAEFLLEDLIALAGFPVPEARPTLEPERIETLETGIRQKRNALGQGDITVTPLHWAAIMSAIAGDGSARLPHILDATRKPDASFWAPANHERSTFTMMSASTAASLRTILKRSWARILNLNSPEDVPAGAHIVMSQSGDEKQVWLNGFVTPTDEASIAFVILLEDTDEIDALLPIGQALIDILLNS